MDGCGQLDYPCSHKYLLKVTLLLVAPDQQPACLNIQVKRLPFTMHTQQLTQIHLGPKPQEYEPVAQSKVETSAYALEEAKLQDTLLKLCPANLWHNGSYSSGCPRPILVGNHHQQQMQDLHEALTIAITDIVQRWWTDRDARFPERMPLEKEEEEILRVSLHPCSTLRSTHC